MTLSSRNAFIFSMNRFLNAFCVVDRSYPSLRRLLHSVDHVSRYSAAFMMSSFPMNESTFWLEACWLSQLWLPESFKVDSAFAKHVSKNKSNKEDIEYRNFLSSRHSNNLIWSKHSVIKSIFIMLINTSLVQDGRSNSFQAISISNDLYGIDIVPPIEVAWGYKNPVKNGYLFEIVDEIIDASNKHQAKKESLLQL